MTLWKKEEEEAWIYSSLQEDEVPFEVGRWWSGQQRRGFIAAG